MPFDVTIPIRLRQQHREAIEAALGRLEIAAAADDRALMLGSSKELIETVAKVGLRELGVPYDANRDFNKLVRDLLVELERHPELYQNRPGLQKIANAYKQVASAIEELRNHEGTGHGQPTPTDLELDHAGFVLDSATLWAKWILNALDDRLAARDALEELINDLDQFVTFMGGELVARVTELPLATEENESLRRLGRALGRRRARHTIVVETDIIIPLIEGVLELPQALVEGILEGLILDANGYVRIAPSSLSTLVGLADLAPGENAAVVLRDIADQIHESEASYAFDVTDQARAVVRLGEQRDQSGDAEMREALDGMAFAVLALQSRWHLDMRLTWTGEGGNTQYTAVWYPNMDWFVVGNEDQLLRPGDVGIPFDDAVAVLHQPHHRLQVDTVSPIRIVYAELVGPDETRYEPDESGGGLPNDEWFVAFRDVSF